MSQYINSFLIEPVVRQARRFSRPNNEPYNEQGDQQEAGLHHAEIQTTAITAVQEDSSALILDTPDDVMFSITSEDTEMAEVPNSLDSADPNEQSVEQHERIVPFRINHGEASSQLSQSAADIQAFQQGDDTSANPLFAAQRFRSPASSISSSRSLIDAHLSPVDGITEGRRSGDSGERMSEPGAEAGLPRDNLLPADDGMGEMRQRIIAIQRTDSSNEVKARQVHDLMVEKHNTSQQSLHVIQVARAHSPISIQSSDRPFTPSSPKSTESLRQTLSPPTSSGSGSDPAKQFYLSSEDLKPTYYEKPSAARTDGRDTRRTSETEESRDLGCAHYKRNIKLQCSACHRWYTCRFCHDAVEDHMLNRKETKNMLCMLCGCAQAASEACTMCGERGAWYYCDVCKLWDDDPNKSIYHCNDCGICRVGQGLGKDFFHCKTCCVCMSISIRDTHRCIERSTDCDCPICGEYMFTSPQTVVFMRCGHSIHHRCYHEHMKTSYRCPICNRSIVNMEWQFSRLERAIEAQPMPEEFRDTKAFVYCNDCNAKTSVRYHWLGLKCAVCDSYNTAQLQLLSGPDPTGADFAEAPPTTTAERTLSTDATAQHTDLSISRPHSPTRGRPRHPHHHQSTHSRSGISAPPSSTNLAAVAASLTSSQHHHHSPLALSRAHSATPGNPTATAFPFSNPPSDDDEEDSDPESSDADDSMEAYSEVDFWGGESPSSTRQNNDASSPPPLLLGQHQQHQQQQQVGTMCSCRDGLEISMREPGGESEEDGEDSEEELVGEAEDEDDDEEEGGGAIELELIGHR